MDFFRNAGMLLLLIVCIGIVFIFLKDYLRLTGRKNGYGREKKNNPAGIVYEIRYKNKTVDRGTIDMESLPVQFGREAGYGNDIIVVPDDVPEEDGRAVSRAWFFISRDAREQLMIYSAEASAAGEEKQLSTSMKLLVSDGDRKKPARSVKLGSEVVLLAENFKVILGVQK